MTRDPKWFSTSPKDRKRKPIELTLPPDCIAWLTREARRRTVEFKQHVSRSGVVEELIRDAMVSK